jgi:GTP-binding protein HflX
LEPRRRDTHVDRLSPKGSPNGPSATGRALVIEPVLRRAAARADAAERTAEAKLDEAIGLARAIDLDVEQSGIVMLRALHPANYLSKGKVEEIAGLVKSFEAGIVVMDCALTPVQQRNLEKAWNAKVLDRTSLILEIFGRRARTREGALQVEHAHLTYQKGRLVRTWPHLERQRGGFGFLGGPGETQLEADRRIIEERLAKIEGELAKVKRTRALHRESRRRVPYPIVALVGYTNAGKSTLFNRMTAASVLSADMLFATLDPTLRAVALAHGARIILSDTVGFISDLPTMLIAAFRATLEEVIEADVILHVRDVSHEDAEAQLHDVEKILHELGIDPHTAHKRTLIEVWNKIDRLDAAERLRLQNIAERRPLAERPVLVSAMTGEGIDALATAIEERLAEGRVVIELELDPADGAGVSWLHRHTEVIAKTFDAKGRAAMTVRVAPDKAEAVRARFGSSLPLPAARGEVGARKRDG